MAFDIFRTLSLDFFGEEWKDCYLKFHYVNVEEAKKFAGMNFENTPENTNHVVDVALDLLTSKFVGGKGVREGKIVDITKEEIKDLPIEVINKSITLLTGVDEVKKKD